MDPNAALEELRRMVREIEGAADNCGHEVSALVYDFTDRFSALDEWLSRGGFKPAEWS